MILAFSTWFLPFVTDLWCWLDVFVVGMSLASVVLTDEPTGIVRIMRALRVLRIFGRLKSLRKIMSALALAIVPVCQVFVILFVLLCIGTVLLSKCPSYFCTCLLGVPPDLMLEACAGAVVGVAVFSSVAPDNFGTFDAAFLSLFYVTGGDPWPDSLPKFNEDGSANWTVAAFIITYTLIEIWVILQVW